MVVHTNNYKSFKGTGTIYIGNKQVYGMGINTFGAGDLAGSIRGLGVYGLGLPSWAQKLKNRVIVFGKKALPQLVSNLTAVGKHLVSENGAAFTKALAAEAERSLPGQKGELAKLAINTLGNAATTAAKTGPKPTDSQKAISGVVGKAAEGRLTKMLDARKAYPAAKAEVRKSVAASSASAGGALNSAQNVISQ